ncbi:hypothetical protein HN51_061714, partial [Arachis hypogaea]
MASTGVEFSQFILHGYWRFGKVFYGLGPEQARLTCQLYASRDSGNDELLTVGNSQRKPQHAT